MKLLQYYSKEKNRIKNDLCGIVTIILLCLSILAMIQETSNYMIILEENSFIANQMGLMSSKSDEILRQKYDELTAPIEKQEFTFSKEDMATLNDSLHERIYENWIKNPQYAYSEEKQGNWETITTQSPERCEITRELNVDGRTLIETRVFSGRPNYKLVQSQNSNLNNITVPVLPEVVGTGAQLEPEYYKFKHNVSFELVPDGATDDTWSIGFWGLFKAFEWVYTSSTTHRLVFPFTFEIEYPKEVMENQEYEYRCTVYPIDIPNFYEYEEIITSTISFNVYNIEYFLNYGWTTCSLFLLSWPCKWFYTDQRWILESSESTTLDPIVRRASYTSPFGDTVASLQPRTVDVGAFCRSVPILDFFGQFIELSITSRTDYKSYGLFAMMEIPEIRWWGGSPKLWTNSGEQASINFKVPSGAYAPKSLTFKLTNLIFTITPIMFLSLTAGFKNGWMFGWLYLPLGDWFGTKTIELAVPLFIPEPITSSQTYTSNALGIKEDLTGVYDFSMKIERIPEGQDPQAYKAKKRSPYAEEVVYSTKNPSYIDAQAQYYAIYLENSNLLVNQSDKIELSVSGLPEGYTANFDEDPPYYDLVGNKTEGGILSEYLNDIYGTPSPSSNPALAVAILTISPPKYIKAPPGDWSFSIHSTSTNKEYWGFPEATQTQSATLKIPEINGISFMLENDLENSLKVNQGEKIDIGFFGRNLGNVNDTINVSAILRTDHLNKTWNQVFSVDSYGTGVSDSYQGIFSFIFDRSDLFPSPGIYKLDIQANSSHTAHVDVQKDLVLNFTKAYGVEASITPVETTIFANWESNFTLRLNNTGNVWDNFTIESDGWDDHLIFPTRIESVKPMEPEEIKVTLRIPNPDIIANGSYSFRIIIKSESSGLAFAFAVTEANVTLLSPDRVPPGIVRADPFRFQPEPLVFPQSPLSLGPGWRAYDEYNNTYTIFIDEVLIETANWNIGEIISVPVTSLSVGLHNVTIAFSDVSGNTAIDQVWVKIEPTDTTPPSILPVPKNTTFPEDFIAPQCFGWNITEEYILNATFYRNSTVLPLTELCITINEMDPNNGIIRYQIQPSTLTVGTWNYTLVLQDMSNNFAASSIMVDITPFDSIEPSIYSDPISSAYIGDSEEISVIATDDFPSHYELWRNNIILQNGTWESDIPITFSVDDVGLGVGVNDLELFIFDLSGNFIQYTWSFDLEDIKPPVLVASVSSFTIFEHNFTMDQAPEWILLDDDVRLGSYEIYLDTQLFLQGTWVPGNGSIKVPAFGLAPGTHQFRLNYYDATGNMGFTTVEVTILDVIAPYILPLPDIHFEPFIVADWFEFVYAEKHPATYDLYRNGALIDTGTLISNFPFVFVSIDDYSTGKFNYTLIISDESDNYAKHSVFVRVTDYSPPLVERPPDMVIPEGTSGVLTWTIREANQKNYSLYQDGILIDFGTTVIAGITHSFAGLNLGEHTFTLLVNDQYGYSHTCISYVNVLDITPPSLSHIGDCRFVETDPDAQVRWNATDKHPDQYIITIDGSPLSPVSWDGGEIVIQCRGWPHGNYTVELAVYDSSGNIATVTVEIEIVSKESEQTKLTGPGFELMLSLVVFISIISFRMKKKRKS